ncbi:Signal recognition particle subunit SRP68 [Sphaceloma murrayae]|uniref:Signal recognition particle subunit SRP68 n=1 Tax=Sphaceloma murrayae TaxID=2082308 RepID=A0A2K1QPP4_9PEZI|nr:Signal recognition particle subunit SRP68 [Sphaceloma murrayae]
MDITEYAIGLRDDALLVGDYKSYREQLSRKVLATRRRLGRTTSKNAKFQKKPAVTAENIKENPEYAHLLLLTAERAWAHGMHLKSTKSEESTGQAITGDTRYHIISRLSKASKSAKELYTLLEDRAASGSNNKDLVEARAYVGLLSGTLEFEKQSEGRKSKEDIAKKERWHPCLQEYSMARIVYAAMQKQTKKEVYRDLLNNTIDPTIRYAAYQAKVSRSVAVPSVALQFYPRDEGEIAAIVKEMDPAAFDEHKPVKDQKAASVTGEAPSSINWRGRSANIVDASIGQALAQAAIAERKLSEYLKSNNSLSAGKRANAYDDILIAWQDAADANRRATEELEKEGVDEGDSRMQDLRVSSLAINYDLVSWRVGRNRVLIGEDDGRSFPEQEQRKPKRPRRDGKPWPEKTEPRSKKLSRLRERVVLYDSTIQSIDSVKSLRGAMRDSGFVAELDGKRDYFQALKCLNIAISHSMLSDSLKALALLSRAGTLASQAASSLPASSRQLDSPPTLEVRPEQAQVLQKQLRYQIIRHQAIANMHKIEQDAAVAAKKAKIFSSPVVERITDYPQPGLTIDLTNLVTYPPNIEPIPVKPLFFDVAFNYLDYPGRAKSAVEKTMPSTNGTSEVSEKPQEEKKRGWFGFGR